MHRPLRSLIIVTSINVLTAHSGSAVCAAALRTVTLTGKPAPGTADGTGFTSFDTYVIAGPYQIVRGLPVINDSGRTAFRANVGGVGVDVTNNQGIWSEGAGSLALVARSGNHASGMPDGVNFGRNPALELFTPVMNAAGDVAFHGGLADGSVGVWSGNSSELTLIARDGMPAPGTPEGVNYSFSLLRDFSYNPDLPKLNDAGQIEFLASLTGEGIDSTNDWGIWSGAVGAIELVARSGNLAPAISDGANFDSFFYHSGLNDVGQNAAFAFLTGSSIDPSNDVGVWSLGGGAPRLVARTGDAAPGAPSGVRYQELYAPVSINNAGRFTFQGLLTGDGVDVSNDQALWSEGSGNLELVARRGSPAPGTPAGVNFGEFLYSVYPVLNDAGQIAFRANLSGTGITTTNNQGIWTDVSGSLTLLARTGNAAPGTPTGVRFSDVHLPALNSQGQVAFRGSLTGTGIGSTNDRGIWATDAGGNLQLVVRKGSQLEVAPGEFRTIADLDFVTSSGNSDSRASGFNNFGQLAFWARFTNGTQGIFVSNLVSSVLSLPGDFNKNGIVDAADYTVWRNHLGTTFDLYFNGDETGASAGIVDLADYTLWKAHFGETLGSGLGAAGSASVLAEPFTGAVPEPGSHFLAAMGLGVVILQRRRRVYIAQAIALTAALWLVTAITAQASTIDFDPTAKSAAIIPFDPKASFEAQNLFVTGRVPRDVKGPVQGGTNINTLLGADSFYSQGYTGTNAVIASIESGHIWSGHETLTHVQQIPNHPAVLNEFDRHATWVGMFLAGRRGGTNPGAYQEGMAPDAQLYSGALARQFQGQRYARGASTFNHAATYDQYRRASNTGVNASGRTADVINGSWGGFEAGNGSGTLAIALDGMANVNPHTLFVFAAGNEGPGPDMVRSPAAAYNNLSVAALGPNPPYDRPAWLSSGGPADYVDPINGTRDNARQVIDVAAPGENLSAAYYGGETGGNGTTDNPAVGGTGPTGVPDGSLGGPDYYSRGNLGGTSFASPIVAGGATLLYDAAYDVFADNADARDARVMKAVLMNSADKTVGWNNGQVAHPNGNGGVLTTQGLDNRVGTGRLNLASAFDQFLTGTTDIAGTIGGNLGLVDDFGWDFGQVASGTTNDYFFDSPLDGGSTFTATLTWFRDRQINASNTVFDDSYDDLNLELWSVVGGIPTSLISESRSLYNESEHFSFALPVTGDYALRVRWFTEVFDRVADADQEWYGLAWRTGATLATVTIPEPASVVTLMIGVMGTTASRRALRTESPGSDFPER